MLVYTLFGYTFLKKYLFILYFTNIHEQKWKLEWRSYLPSIPGNVEKGIRVSGQFSVTGFYSNQMLQGRWEAPVWS